jgi:hypothetical protein
MNALGFFIYATLVVIGCIGDITFLILYTIKSHPKWWHDTVSAHVFSFSALFGILYIRTLFRLFNPETRVAITAQSFGDVLFAQTVAIAAAIVVWWRLLLLLSSLKEEKKEREEAKR